MIVYQLTHFYEHGESKENDEFKDLGIYSSRKLAEEAISRYSKLPGFKDLPMECFLIGECVVDKDSAWTEGFLDRMNWQETLNR